MATLLRHARDGHHIGLRTMEAYASRFLSRRARFRRRLGKKLVIGTLPLSAGAHHACSGRLAANANVEA
jgi:hypothetical protein